MKSPLKLLIYKFKNIERLKVKEGSTKWDTQITLKTERTVF